MSAAGGKSCSKVKPLDVENGETMGERVMLPRLVAQPLSRNLDNNGAKRV
jgi:hypothetical protein